MDLSNLDLKLIVARQPVAVGILTNDKFMFYESGILTEDFLKCSSGKEQVNHGVSVVGFGRTKYDDDLSEYCEEYWIVKNTWGPRWGEKGFFRLCMDGTGSKKVPYGTCQINRYPTYPTMDPEDTIIPSLIM